MHLKINDKLNNLIQYTIYINTGQLIILGYVIGKKKTMQYTHRGFRIKELKLLICKK